MAEEGQEQSKEYQLKEPHNYKIIGSYMPESLELDAINIALIAVDKYKQLKDIAFYIKHEYDKKYPGSGKATEGVYHCVVGKSFASKSTCQKYIEQCSRSHSIECILMLQIDMKCSCRQTYTIKQIDMACWATTKLACD